MNKVLVLYLRVIAASEVFAEAVAELEAELAKLEASAHVN